MATTYPVAQASVRPERRLLTLEQGLYLLLAVLSLITHLYLLGDRALHHDETLHASYSWRLYRGQGYTHDPLMHGPFLYYFTALIFFLFGDSDTTARLGAALFGTVAVLLPLLLRRELGRGGALLASAYLLLSPVFLYVGRFIRHDIFAVTFELLAVIGVVRYVDGERPGWHYLFAAALGLMLATMETFYIFALILLSYLVVWLLWSVGRRLLVLLAGYGLLTGLALAGLPRIASIGPLPLPTEQQALDIRNQPDNNWSAYFAKLGPVVGALLRHPAVLTALALTLALAALLIWLLWVKRDASGRSAWRRAADAAPAGSLLRAVDRVPARQWLWAILLATAIYAVLYTAILSSPAQPNTAGLVTGVLGSFLYWLGQHGVRRGGQPAHYYLFQLALYEPLLLIFGLAGVALVVRNFFHAARRTRAEDVAESAPQNGNRWASRVVKGREGRWAEHELFLPGLLAWWSVGALLIYSWAGEKMPWLTAHLVLPLALLSGWALHRLLRWAWRDGVARITWALMGMALALIVPALILLGITTADPQKYGQVWFWPLLILGALALLGGGATLLVGARQGLLALLSAILLLLTPFTVRSSLQLAFRNGDVPVEPMVFVQTSPDVARVMRDLQRASLLHGSRLAMPIRYDNETIWQWYLRNYTQTEGSGGTTLGSINEDVQAVFLLQENLPANEAQLEGFVRQRYPLRWWFPECEVYRFPASDKDCGPNPQGSSVLSRFVRRPWEGQAIAEMWQFWVNRKLPAPLGSVDWVLLVRPEIANILGVGGQTGP
jgi:uncharacterized protein (TIGR03663 family)